MVGEILVQSKLPIDIDYICIDKQKEVYGNYQ